MATRIATHILKNSNILSRPLPSTLFKGEPIVNTADGIVYFSGNTASTSGWTPAGANTTFFEVGSNLYDLQLRNRITKYEGATGAGLVGKFLSGTTNGFTLADISSISGVDTYTTGFTYSNNTATIKRNLGQPDLSIIINAMTGLTVNGTLSATTANLGTINATSIGSTAGTITTLGSTTATLGTANITSAANIVSLGASAGTINTLGSTNANITTLNATGSTILTLSAGTLNLGNIGSYNGSANVSGQFLSGTTNGFVLVPISAMTSLDTFTTGFTYSNNTATIKRNQGLADLSISINTMTGLTVSGTLNASAGTITTLGSTTATIGTGNITTANINSLGATAGTITTLGSTTATLGTGNITTANINNLGSTAGTITTLASTTATLGTANATTLNATGSTILTLSAGTLNLGNIASYNGLTNVTGKYLSGTASGFVLADVSGITGIDTYVTGFTYSPTTNTINLAQNQGQAAKTITISTVSGLTVSNLNPNYLVYTTTGGALVTNTAASFDGTNMILPAAGSLSVGTGGLTVGSGGSPGVSGTGDVVINGSLTVFGASVSAFTSQLYVEDNNVTLNFNPTGNTTATSVGAGWTIQDGNGVNGGSVNFDVRAMNAFTGLTAGNVPSITEYGGSTGYANRAWVTQLNDVVIRSNNVTTPNGVRVLAEFDILDGGVY